MSELYEKPDLSERDIKVKMTGLNWWYFDGSHKEQHIGIYGKYQDKGFFPMFVYYAFGFQLLEVEIIPDEHYEKIFGVYIKGEKNETMDC